MILKIAIGFFLLGIVHFYKRKIEVAPRPKFATPIICLSVSRRFFMINLLYQIGELLSRTIFFERGYFYAKK